MTDLRLEYLRLQLYDVEQECSGLMTYDRKMKFDPSFFYGVNTRRAAMEGEEI